MNKISQAEQYLLGQIRRGDNEAWSQLVNRYEGRLLHFAQAKLPQRTDCEDLVQETFISFIKSLNNYREDCGLESYLFAILRRKIIDSYRRKRMNDVCLIQDIYGTGSNGQPYDALKDFAAPNHTGSWYVSRDEDRYLQQRALVEALSAVVDGVKSSLNFRDLEVVELVFYCHLSNNDIAKIMNVGKQQVALIKHRCIRQVQRHLAKLRISTESFSEDFDNVINELWQVRRLSCPKRSTIGAYLLGTLDQDWHDYVEFHVNKLGCQFCRANLEDLKRQNTGHRPQDLSARIMESTVGFLYKPS